MIFWFDRISLSYVPYNWIHSVICWYFYFLKDWDIIQAQCKPIIILASSLATIDNTTRILNFDICWNNYRCNSRKCSARSWSLLSLPEINRVEESTLKEDICFIHLLFVKFMLRELELLVFIYSVRNLLFFWSTKKRHHIPLIRKTWVWKAEKHWN